MSARTQCRFLVNTIAILVIFFLSVNSNASHQHESKKAVVNLQLDPTVEDEYEDPDGAPTTQVTINLQLDPTVEDEYEDPDGAPTTQVTINLQLDPTVEDEYEDPDGAPTTQITVNLQLDPTVEDEYEDPDGVPTTGGIISIVNSKGVVEMKRADEIKRTDR